MNSGFSPLYHNLRYISNQKSFFLSFLFSPPFFVLFSCLLFPFWFLYLFLFLMLRLKPRALCVLSKSSRQGFYFLDPRVIAKYKDPILLPIFLTKSLDNNRF